MQLHEGETEMASYEHPPKLFQRTHPRPIEADTIDFCQRANQVILDAHDIVARVQKALAELHLTRASNKKGRPNATDRERPRTTPFGS
jgi:hypothetical protein